MTTIANPSASENRISSDTGEEKRIRLKSRPLTRRIRSESSSSCELNSLRIDEQSVVGTGLNFFGAGKRRPDDGERFERNIC